MNLCLNVIKNNWKIYCSQAYEYWLNDMYLNYRDPIPINSNPGMVLPPKKFTTILDVARFTARLVDAALDHKDILNRHALPVERATSRYVAIFFTNIPIS